MVFCNVLGVEMNRESVIRHNPYFNRWFSAIDTLFIELTGNNQSQSYFNRWFSAIGHQDTADYFNVRHNPYFNRWFSAISVSTPMATF